MKDGIFSFFFFIFSLYLLDSGAFDPSISSNSHFELIVIIELITLKYLIVILLDGIDFILNFSRINMEKTEICEDRFDGNDLQEWAKFFW